MMIKLGITGNLGSGKSVVASFLNTTGIPVYSADDEAKRIIETSQDVRDRLTNHFGTQLYEGTQLNKSLFASLIFDNEEQLKAANAIIHPEVLKDFLVWTTKQRKPVVAIEAAILFESGFQMSVDRVLTVTAPLEMRIRRVMERSGMTREDVLARILYQLPDEWKIERSDWVVYNDDQQAIIPQLEKIINVLLPT